MASTSSSSHSTSNVENLPPHLIRLITKQMVQLHREPPAEGVCVHMNHDDVSDVQATIVGPEHTPYESGHFRIKLVLPPDYPAQQPRGYFLTKIFHPNVATANGEICVNALKRATDSSSSSGSSQGNGSTTTTPAGGSLGHVMVVIKCLLINPNPESALNEEAGKLLLEDYEEFAKRAKLMTEIHARAPNTSSRLGAAGANRNRDQTKDSETKSSSSSSSSSCPDDTSSGSGSNKRSLAESNNSTTDLPSSSSQGSNANANGAGGQSQSVLNKKKKLKRL